VKRLDEVRATKQPIVRYGFEQHEEPEPEPAATAVETPKGV
jgi:hypothetical protein